MVPLRGCVSSSSLSIQLHCHEFAHLLDLLRCQKRPHRRHLDAALADHPPDRPDVRKTRECRSLSTYSFAIRAMARSTRSAEDLSTSSQVCRARIDTHLWRACKSVCRTGGG